MAPPGAENQLIGGRSICSAQISPRWIYAASNFSCLRYFIGPFDGVSRDQTRASKLQFPDSDASGCIYFPTEQLQKITQVQFWTSSIDPPGLVVAIVDPLAGETIIDCCAAPGGKTLFMASKLRSRGQKFFLYYLVCLEGTLFAIFLNSSLLGLRKWMMSVDAS